MNIIPYIPAHYELFAPHDGHVELSVVASHEHAATLAESGMAFTGEVDGRVVGCAGCAELWPGRYVMWAVLSAHSGPCMLAITRAAKRLLLLFEGRIEITVVSGYEAGARWARLLGFALHHHEERFFPGGVDADVYVRFQ